jgi:hypothetical protein
MACFEPAMDASASRVSKRAESQIFQRRTADTEGNGATTTLSNSTRCPSVSGAPRQSLVHPAFILEASHSTCKSWGGAQNMRHACMMTLTQGSEFRPYR